MANTDRAQTHDLIADYLRDRDLRRAGMFPVVRQMEARAPEKPRIGRAKRPEHSIVDLAQEATMAFPDRTLVGVEPRYNRPQLRGYWLGLTGPMGPLPLHLSEFVFYERRYAKKRPFGDWLDLISGRMLQMFYRAWAETQPTAHADRPGDDRFAHWLSALSGCSEGVRPNAAFFPRARVHYAAVFAGLRSAAAIQDALTHLLGQPVRVNEYLPKWREFEKEDLSKLGRSFSTLGSDAALGSRVLSASDAFRVIVRADSFRDYRTLLPGGERFKVAAEAIDAFKPGHLEWDLTVEIDDADAPPARLDGRIQLGWTSWLKRPSAARKMTRRGPGPGSGLIRADAHLRKSSMKPRKAKP